MALVPQASALANGAFTQLPFRVDGNGEFTQELPVGLYALRTFRPSTGYYVESATGNGRDVLKDGFEVLPGGGHLDIVVRRGAISVTGMAAGPEGNPVPRTRVVLIPDASSRGPLTQFSAVGADNSEAFRFKNVRPGTYRLLAVDESYRIVSCAEPYYQAREFLERFEMQGVRISLEDGTSRREAGPVVVPTD